MELFMDKQWTFSAADWFLRPKKQIHLRVFLLKPKPEFISTVTVIMVSMSKFDRGTSVMFVKRLSKNKDEHITALSEGDKVLVGSCQNNQDCFYSFLLTNN